MPSTQEGSSQTPLVEKTGGGDAGRTARTLFHYLYSYIVDIPLPPMYTRYKSDHFLFQFSPTAPDNKFKRKTTTYTNANRPEAYPILPNTIPQTIQCCRNDRGRWSFGNSDKTTYLFGKKIDEMGRLRPVSSSCSKRARDGLSSVAAFDFFI